MAKCSSCGLEVDETLENCPNCGNDLLNSEEPNENSSVEKIECSNCGAELDKSLSFCPSCGSKVENEDEVLRCKECGSELPENTLFCSVCGAKVDAIKKESAKTCPNCGAQVAEDTTFCAECGANVFTGEKNSIQVSQQGQSFTDKLNFNVILKPTVAAVAVSIILSLIGLLIGFSWFSFVIAIILSVVIFGAAIDNDANAIVFGLIVGLILGLLETPLVEFMYGAFVAGFYEGFFGGHLILIVILGIVFAYVSNMYLKENILSITDNFKGML